MKFYPIVYTRTALRDPVKGRDGVDFVYRALAPGFVGSPLENLTRQAINEDRFPAMTTPRRVFCRTEKYVFWGLALHNDFFLPSEVCEALELSEGERKLRGFWGGFVELHEGDVLSNETLRWIAATLESRDSDSALTNDVASLFKTQVEKESTFVGRSPFVFASRLFQRFVQKDWTNPKVPKRDGERNLNFAPIISEKPFDLRFFAPEPSETSEFAPLPVDALQLFASANFNDVDATNALWRRFVFASNARLHVVAPLTCENHADRCVSSDCALDATALLDATGVRAYRPNPRPEKERGSFPCAASRDRASRLEEERGSFPFAASRDRSPRPEEERRSFPFAASRNRSPRPEGRQPESPTFKPDDAFDEFSGFQSAEARKKSRRWWKRDERDELKETRNGREDWRREVIAPFIFAVFDENIARPFEGRERDGEDESVEERRKRISAEIAASARAQTPRMSRLRDEESGNETRRPVEPPEIDFYAGRGQAPPRSDANEDRGMF